MTISIAWVRKRSDFEEMYFASDSRLSGEQYFDACPKMLALPRNDCAIAFAGVSGDGFSMMLQLSLAIEAFPPAKNRRVELTAVRTHALRIFSAMSERISTEVHGARADFIDPGAEFLFGGYGWRSKGFELSRLSFHVRARRFVARNIPILCWDIKTEKLVFTHRPRRRHRAIGKIALAGDQRDAAMKLLMTKLTMRIRSGELIDRLDMEPLEVICDLLRTPALRMPPYSKTIGGPPQLLRVLQSAQTASIAIYWPHNGSRTLHLQGRPCLHNEILNVYCLDPDTKQFNYLGYAGSSYSAFTLDTDQPFESQLEADED